ncbi:MULTISPECIES: carbohydrate ABC transporter permease [Microbacterium]|uniref:Sugar ABC transporter permease n=1 Tax=Microbacterium aurantiacum TaxID=162393 RepID=A0AAJ2HGJ5_9MICO|nr:MULTISPECIES: sugar ABC transporter permease [Microbacterium]MBN9201119.1 sugar ABC transporter permease [Microbacterium chocolatum]MDN4464444.1 sugar ABC transporter permease [Microbacterium aurantiacum]MDS0245242.1 sugar ABC transporter permease [Microbacterium aurantiacum]ODT40163.1 MAG: sugar ABC transporter permease [Microbacterium sp. SCN 71-17]
MTTTVTPPPALRTPRRRRLRVDERGWLFVAPFAIVFALVFLTPLLYSLYLSFFREQLVGGNTFVGLDNYIRALSDPNFWDGFTRVLLFLLIQVPIMLLLALAAALAIDSARLHAAGFYRIVIFLPYAVPAVVAVLMWGYIYGDRFGLTSNLNDLLGSNVVQPFLPQWMMLSIGNIVTWQFVGYNMLIFYSALKTIPNELYEAASIDGAGAWRTIFAIKIPSVRGALVIATIFSIIGSFQLFNEPNILKPLAPNVITTYYTPNMYAYNLSFAGQQYNYAATVAIIMGLITAIIAYVVQLRGSRQETR